MSRASNAHEVDPAGPVAARGGPAALSVADLEVEVGRGGERVLVVEELDLTVRPGECVAIVGESGSGKSLSVRAMLGLLPDGVTSRGRLSLGADDLQSMRASQRRQLRGARLAYVMQDPFTMLDPLERVGVQLAAKLRRADGGRLSRSQRRAEAVRRLAEVGITDEAVADRRPYELSGGMRQRVAIAAAIAEEPEVLIADEPTTALDVTTQKDILELLKRLCDSRRLGLVLVTHDLGVATTACDRIYVMYAGGVVEEAPARDFLDRPRHPYSAALVGANPPIDVRVGRLPTIPGSVPGPGERNHGCRFLARCEFARPSCDAAVPALEPVDTGHRVRCHRWREIDPSATVVGRPAATASPAAASGAVDPGPAEELIVVRGASRVYGTKIACDDVDLTVRRGESVGIVGESGSGKTTLARLVMGLATPTAGVVEVGGVRLDGRRLSRTDRFQLHSTVQMAFQDPQSTLNPHLTVGSTVREALRLARRDDVEAGLHEVLELVGLDASYAQRRPIQLSGGQRQRVAIARAVARGPQLLVCDEVVSALDVSVQALILNLFLDLRERLGLGYVFITHDLAVARQVTDRLVVMKGGRVVESGPTDQVLDDPQHEYTQTLIASVPRPASVDKGVA